MGIDPVEDQQAATKDEVKVDPKHKSAIRREKKRHPWAKKTKKSKSAASTANLSTKTSMDGVTKQPQAPRKGKGLAGAVQDLVEDDKEHKSRVCEEVVEMGDVRGKKPRRGRNWKRKALEEELASLREEENEYNERLGRKKGDMEVEDEGRRSRRTVAVQCLGMESKVDDIAAKMAELGMGRKHGKQG
jgi:hypothetical protein